MRPRGIVLPDTSFYITELRQGRDPLVELEVLNPFFDVAVCGVVCCEFGRGLRRREQLARFRAAWDLMLYLPTDNRLWRETEDLLWSLGRAGLQIPLPDAVIAASARRCGATVLTMDRHFEHVPGLRVVRSVREMLLRDLDDFAPGDT